MCLLLETIKIINHQPQNLEYHQARLDASSSSLFGGRTVIDLKTQLQIPDFVDKSVYKCRVIYDRQMREISFEAYHPKTIQSLKLVYDDEIEYAYKYADRTAINRLYEQRDSCDDILIVKQGLISDTSFCNILFWDGKDWLTPNTPLLPGTRRQALIDQKIIRPQQISAADLANFSRFMLVNAMLDFNEIRSQKIREIEK